CCCFFFQAEDGIRAGHVTGVQTCALPIWQAGEYVDSCAVRLVGGLAHGRLEAVTEVEDDVGALDAADRTRRQFEIVRLGAGRGEIGRASCRERVESAVWGGRWGGRINAVL